MAAKHRNSSNAARRYPCACCGRRDTAERMVFSSWTGNRYCPPGVGCEKSKRKGAR